MVLRRKGNGNFDLGFYGKGEGGVGLMGLFYGAGI